MEFSHISVLFNEVIESLQIKNGGIYVDGTLGGGGHTEGILMSESGCSVIGTDRDTDALKAAGKRLERFGERFRGVHSNFSDIKAVLGNLGIDGIDGAVLDLGVSSYQLDTAERGFSYMHDAPLDMRMDRTSGESAYHVINDYTVSQLTDIFYKYGEEKWSKRIAEFIEAARKEKNIETTGELVKIITDAIPKSARLDGGHPAKRVFQAVRIEVNGELRILEQALKDFCECLKPGGRLAVITFHSLEDRIVKNTFRDLCTGCVCPKEFPVCVCGHTAEAELLFRKPLLPSVEEQERNPRSKSAKLRVLVKK